MTFDPIAARQNMVEAQLKSTKVTDDRILHAFASLPRERFIPARARSKRNLAYIDEDLSIGGGRYLVEPVVLARLIQEAGVTHDDTVLVIGPGTGYSAAVLEYLASQVMAVESDEELLNEARANFAHLGLYDIVTFHGDLTGGWHEYAPYDVILLNGAVSDIPEGIVQQLSPHGRLVTVRRGRPAWQGQGILMTRHEGRISEVPLFDAATPYLPGFEPRMEFVF